MLFHTQINLTALIPKKKQQLSITVTTKKGKIIARFSSEKWFANLNYKKELLTK